MPLLSGGSRKIVKIAIVKTVSALTQSAGVAGAVFRDTP